MPKTKSLSLYNLAKEFLRLEEDSKIMAKNLVWNRYYQGELCLKIFKQSGWDGLRNLSKFVHFSPMYLYDLSLIAEKYSRRDIKERLKGNHLSVRRLIASARDTGVFDKEGMEEGIQIVQGILNRIEQQRDKLFANEKDREAFEEFKKLVYQEYNETLLVVLYSLLSQDDYSTTKKVRLFDELLELLRTITRGNS